MKHILNFISALFLILLVSTAVSAVADIEFANAFAGCVVGSALFSFVPMPQGVASVVVLQQMWETELITAFRGMGDWMGRIPRKDQYVGNNVINLTEIGADPTLLINNTTYPITTAARVDDNIALALNKYDTTNTKITRDELYALPYDKEGSVIRQHRDVIAEGTREHGLWNLTIAGDTANTPLVETTGVDNGASRRAMKTADILRLKLRLDNLKAPKQGRCLVLCAAHVNELMLEDASFNLRYQNHVEGKMVTRYHGFDIYEDTYNPVFTAANAKKAYGAAAAGTDRNASVCFIAERAFQATGTVEMFHRDKSTDPENRETVVGFQLYHIVAPKKTTAFGVIVSDDLL
jgi:hypothetical protein